MRFKYGRFLKYVYGHLCCHADAVHAAKPTPAEAGGDLQRSKMWDIYTGDIVSGVAASGCTAIIAAQSRLSADLNRGPEHKAPCQEEALREYRAVIRRNLERVGAVGQHGQLARPYLHLGVHGISDQRWGEQAVEVGARQGCREKTSSEDVFRWFLQSLKSKLQQAVPGAKIISNKRFIGDPSLAYHRCGCPGYPNYPGYGSNYNAVQLEISYTLRYAYREELTAVLSELVQEFHDSFR